MDPDELDLVGLTDGWDEEDFVALTEGWSEEARLHALEERRLRSQERGAVRPVTRADDKRSSQGQTPSYFTHPHSGHQMTRSEIGDTFEALFARHGSAMLEAKYGGSYKVLSHVEGGSRTTPLDFQIDSSHGGELKTLNVNAGSQKTSIKTAEVARKVAAVEVQGLKPLLVVQVVDMEAGHVRVFTYPQFASKAVSKMSLLGSYSFTDSDLQQAHSLAGYSV